MSGDWISVLCTQLPYLTSPLRGCDLAHSTCSNYLYNSSVESIKRSLEVF